MCLESNIMSWHSNTSLLAVCLTVLIHLQMLSNTLRVVQRPTLEDIAALYWIFSCWNSGAQIDVRAKHRVTTIGIVSYSVRTTVITSSKHQVIAVTHRSLRSVMFWTITRDIKALRMCHRTDNAGMLCHMDFFDFTLAILAFKNNSLCRIVVLFIELVRVVDVLKQMTNVERCSTCCVMNSQLA